MTEYRLAKPEEWEDCIELANYVFSTAHRPHDFEQLIPRVYQAGPEMARIHRVAVAENGRLRAEIAVLPQQMAAGGKLLRAGYVGSVSVHPKARGEGHMKRLLGDWITDLEGTCDLLVLDGQRQRYAYFFADVIEAMLTMKAETMGISDGTWFAVLEGQPLTVTVKDGTVTVTREAHPGADVLNREQAQELLLSPLASKGSKVPSEIWKNIPSDWFPLPLYCATADEF